MIKQLLITKTFSNYAEVFLLLGLAYIVEGALKATNQKSKIQLIDKGTAYVIQFKNPVNLEKIAKVSYFDPFPPVKGGKTDTSKIPPEVELFDTVKQSQVRKLYREFRYQQRGKAENSEEAPKPADSRTQNGVFLTQMRCDRNHNQLWLNSWKLQENYGALLVALFQGFSQAEENPVTQENIGVKQVAELFHKATGCKLPGKENQ